MVIFRPPFTVPSSSVVIDGKGIGEVSDTVDLRGTSFLYYNFGPYNSLKHI